MFRIGALENLGVVAWLKVVRFLSDRGEGLLKANPCYEMRCFFQQIINRIENLDV